MAKTGILTLHLHVNYGGILQAAALYRLLQDEGFDPILLRKEPDNIGRAGRLIRNLLRILPGQNVGGVRARALTRARHEPFIRRFLPNATRPCRNSEQLRRAVQQHGVGAVVVGSDQVWRAEYHQDSNYPVYFLDFVPADVRKLSYAASFGHSDWRYPERTEEVAGLLERFDAVSVREKSGVAICREVLGRQQCTLVLDPTLVVSPSFYQDAAAPAERKQQPTLVSYVLDQGESSEKAHKAVQDALPYGFGRQFLSVKDEGDQETIGQWLRAFMDADFVLTDSYHGTIFSILFQKNFITLGNVERGLDRFTTLLDEIGLADRLVIDPDTTDFASLVARPINYGAVNTRLEELRAASKDYLLSALRGSR
ncbi:polysaccharide pyruvyl transferase family protein [Sphingomonas sp. LHG3406-1]|uniref:polysaccharide pyruvyl transferase family protein n=1 Tax=Sphingomonas sp. LHG3406-1 TaxID=2804617 RepID=UPI00260423C6|nr:polysaccharide pyruvyl transferase family protein [Sphingomonas sp. LHG3406-1]